MVGWEICGNNPNIYSILLKNYLNHYEKDNFFTFADYYHGN